MRRHGVPARPLELVHVEGHGRTGARRRREVGEQRPVVEQEVRRRDHGDRVHSGLGRVGGQRDRVRRRLCAAMRSHPEASGRYLDEALGDAPASAIVANR